MKHVLPILLIIAILSAGKLHAQSTTLSFQYYRSVIFLKLKVNNRPNLLFMLNTGANTSVISKRTAQALKLPTLHTDTVIGTAGKEAVAFVRLKKLYIGKIEAAKDIEVSSRDLDYFMNLQHQHLDGILGMDVLHHFSLLINYKTHKITFTKDSIRSGRNNFIAFDIIDGIPRIPVSLNGKCNTHLQYNSGASLSNSNDTYINISYSQWQQLKKASPYVSHISAVGGKGVGGELEMQIVRITDMDFCSKQVSRPFLVIQPKEGYMSADDAIGFFGNNLLEKYQSVALDFVSCRMALNYRVPLPVKAIAVKMRPGKTSLAVK